MVTLLIAILTANLFITTPTFPKGSSVVCTEVYHVKTDWRPRHCWYETEQDTTVEDDRWPNMPTGKYEAYTTWWDWEGRELKSDIVKFELK